MYGQLFEHAFIPGKHINPYLKAKNPIKKCESSQIKKHQQKKNAILHRRIPILSIVDFDHVNVVPLVFSSQ